MILPLWKAVLQKHEDHAMETRKDKKSGVGNCRHDVWIEHADQPNMILEYDPGELMAHTRMALIEPCKPHLLFKDSLAADLKKCQWSWGGMEK